MGSPLVSFSSPTYPSLRLRAIQPFRTIHAFHPWRPTTRIAEIESKEKISPCPPYPYGSRHTFKEADKGLYGGAQLQSGNKISPGRNKGKTLRRWFPNVRVETIESKALNKTLTIPITASCLRTIQKCGGLDQYLLGDKPARIKELGVFGWELRWRVMNSEMIRQRHQQEREKLGLPPNRPRFESFKEVWDRDPELRLEVQREQEQQWQEMRKKDKRFLQHVVTRWEPKDKKRYKPPEGVPPFNKAAFESFLS